MVLHLLQAQGLGQGDKHSLTLSCGAWSTLPLPLLSKTTVIIIIVLVVHLQRVTCFHANLLVPVAAPVLCQSCFEAVTNTNNATLREVVIYYKVMCAHMLSVVLNLFIS